MGGSGAREVSADDKPSRLTLSPPPSPPLLSLPPYLDKGLLYAGDTAFATRLVAGVKAGKGESWARCECQDYTQGLLNLALDRETYLAEELPVPEPLLQVRLTLVKWVRSWPL